MSRHEASPTSLGGLGGVLLRRWVRAGIALAFFGYASVWGGSILLFGFDALSRDSLSHFAVLVVCAVSLVLVDRRRVRLAAVLMLAAVWLELHADFPFEGLRASALIPFPVLVSGAGLIFGARAAYVIAGCSVLTIPLAASLAGPISGVAAFGSVDDAYLMLVVVAAMFAGAGMVHLGLIAFNGALESARASSKRLAHLIENTPDGLVSTDPEHRIVSVNPAAEIALGVRESDLLGRPLAEVFREVCRNADEALRLEELLDGGEGAAGPVRVEGADEAPRWVEVLAGRLEGADRTFGTQITIRDVSVQQRGWETERSLRAQLEHAQRLEAVGRLAGGVAHEFNNLLTVVGGSAELLLADGHSEGDALVLDILEAKTKGAVLTQQLLAFARKEMVHLVDLSLADLIQGMEPLLRRFVSESHLFVIEVDDTLPEVLADRAQVEQVLVNLVVNAKDAMVDPGRISVGMAGPGTVQTWRGDQQWTVPDGFVEFWVEDTGVGMDAEVAGRAFEPFFTTKARGQGTGLGLATVHGIVSQNGGHLSVFSLPDVGTRVAVQWPISPGR